VLKVGDEVERTGTLVPSHMRHGKVIRVIPNKDGVEWLTEYEVEFDGNFVATFYESQLRGVNKPPKAAD
jgi:hypothetical protein